MNKLSKEDRTYIFLNYQISYRHSEEFTDNYDHTDEIPIV
jgi:hypothetical protein